VLTFGAYTDDVPSMVQVGGGFWYLGNKSLHVYQSIDDAESWVDVNSYHPEIPSVRCVSDDGRYVCGDHFADGYDIAKVVGFGFDAVACLDDATPASCLSGACDTYYEDFLARGEYGGGYCVADLSPAPETGGCGGQDVAAGAFVAGYAALQLRRRSLRR
jgi:hypothetical protein